MRTEDEQPPNVVFIRLVAAGLQVCLSLGSWDGSMAETAPRFWGPGLEMVDTVSTPGEDLVP